MWKSGLRDASHSIRDWSLAYSFIYSIYTLIIYIHICRWRVIIERNETYLTMTTTRGSMTTTTSSTMTTQGMTKSNRHNEELGNMIIVGNFLVPDRWGPLFMVYGSKIYCRGSLRVPWGSPDFFRFFLNFHIFDLKGEGKIILKNLRISAGVMKHKISGCTYMHHVCTDCM